MSAIELLRPSALPALLCLLAWPALRFCPPRHAASFFALTGLLFIAIVEGPLFAVGIAAAIFAAFVLVEAACHRAAPRGAFYGVLLTLHAGYFACFWLPPPLVFVELVPDEQSRTPLFILFSGIALSFFRMVSYAWDRRRGLLARPPWRDFLAYALFFPQFRHGPVERPAAFLAQLPAAQAGANWRGLGLALARLAVTYLALLALALLVMAALNYAPAPIAELDWAEFLADPNQVHPFAFLVLLHAPLVLLYAVEATFASVQLAVSRAFGIRGSENFNRPWLAATPVEVWRRWNITLSSWLRDYAYIPLGGGQDRKHLNIVLTFVYAGVLHAPQLRCVLWGLFTGLGVAACDFAASRWAPPPPAAPLAAAARWAARLLTMHWLALSVIIIADSNFAGTRVLWRYLRLFAGQ